MDARAELIQSQEAEAEEYKNQIHKAAHTGVPVEIPLQTDDRVLARVTDGIYRQPASAIRELIANAYDADATEAVVLTDVPRYSRILVRDNGNGMTADVLVNLIKHIGGSAKRTPAGQRLGVTDPADSKLSRGGRKLIGKIGIGMFSVSQLTRQFTIITKPKEENYRYTAVVTLHRYTDEYLGGLTLESMFHNGATAITSELVEEDEAHGTTILLGELIPGAKKILQSRVMWETFESEPGSRLGRVEPAIHSGLVAVDGDTFEVPPQLPWGPRADAGEKMRQLSDALLNAGLKNELYIQISNTFDYYFKMLWGLGLALPLPYLGVNPFDLPADLKYRCFRLSNKARAAPKSPGQNQAIPLKTTPGKSVRVASGISPPEEGRGFHVEVDGIRLCRPIRYETIPGSERALQTPLLFVGEFNPDLTGYDKTQSGGQQFSFTAYFCWTPRVAPKEHNGLLIRINGASGTLFDPTFMNYQVAEQTRVKQVVAEVFVTEGLEEALNIDRETFNTSHPHYQILLNWVHNALRQVFNKQKDLESTIRNERRDQAATKSKSAVQATRSEELRKALGEEEDTVRGVSFTDDEAVKAKAEKEGKRVFSRSDVVVEPVLGRGKKENAATKAKVSLYEERAAAVTQLLDAYGLLEHLGPAEQRKLLAGILRIFITGE